MLLLVTVSWQRFVRRVVRLEKCRRDQTRTSNGFLDRILPPRKRSCHTASHPAGLTLLEAVKGAVRFELYTNVLVPRAEWKFVYRQWLCGRWDDSAKLRTVFVRSNVNVEWQLYEELRSSYGSLKVSWKSLTNSIIPYCIRHILFDGPDRAHYSTVVKCFTKAWVPYHPCLVT